MKNIKKIVMVVLICGGVYQFSEGIWIKAKAELAQQLIASSWEETLKTNEAQKPWAWSDTWPVARLKMENRDVELFILEGAQGNSLAFGPGHLHGSAMPGNQGVSVIGAHRDTHFSFLENVVVGETLEIENLHGKRRYEITDIKIADSRVEPLIAEQAEDKLLLVTCYPFDQLSAGGPYRYVVTAKPLEKLVRFIAVRNQESRS